MHKPLNIGRLIASFDEQMNMIGHIALRDDFDVARDCRGCDVIPHERNDSCLTKERLSFRGAERQEVTASTDVNIRRQTRAFGAHVRE